MSVEEKCSSGSSARRSERPSVSSLASTASPSADESDSGFHGYRSRRHHRSPDGRSLEEGSECLRALDDRLNTSCDSSVILRPGDRQPLYANAPPKPKRLNSSRDYSTSPERSPERDERDPRVYTDHGGGGSVVVGVPDGRALHYHPPTAERRTPDAYGVTAGGGRGDYEDVYGDSNGSNSIPHSPVRRPDQRDSYASSRSGGTRLSEEFQLSDTLRSNIYRQEDTLPRVSSINPHHRHHRLPGPPRPHSADFLEYDRKHSGGGGDMWSYRRGSGGDLPRHQDIRPKSSIGQNESDHWSEENYAQKMRQSSLYHSHMHSRSSSRYSPAGPADSPCSEIHHVNNTHSNVPQRVPPAGAATPDLYTPYKPNNSTPSPASTTTNSLRRGAGQESKENNKRLDGRLDGSQDHLAESRHYTRQDLRQTPRPDGRQDTWPDPRPNQRAGVSQDPRRVYNHDELPNKHEPSPNTTMNSIPTPPGSHHNSASPNGSINNSFMRSASARLPRHRLPDDAMNTSLPDDGSDSDSRKIQQREESMKRLLEWKQRMLQSPLTRKPTTTRSEGTTTPQPRTTNEAYRQQVLNELATQEARTKVMQNQAHLQNSSVPGMETTLIPPPPVPLSGPPHGYQTGGALPTRMTSPGPNNKYAPMSHGGLGPPGLSPSSTGLPGERPAPQGGSSHPGSDSGGGGSGGGGSGSGSKRREGRRENSRTRHMSGGESRRSTSASRYNSYSSDEDDLMEERETRKKSRRSSRRSSADLTRDSRRMMSAVEGSRGWDCDQPHDIHPDVPTNNVPPCEYSLDNHHYLPQQIPPLTDLPKVSPDYVNINVVSESRGERGSAVNVPPGHINTPEVNNLYSERTVSQRAEPVFIEKHEGYDEVRRFDPSQSEEDKPASVTRNCEQSFVYSDQIYATRDPYYVSDVQLPAMNDCKFEEEKSSCLPSVSSEVPMDLNTSYVSQNSVHNQFQVNSDAYDLRDYGKDRRPIDVNKSFLHEAQVRDESLDSTGGFSSYDSHSIHKIDNVGMHIPQKSSSQDDTTSTGKYSDSGYDTLRAEMSMRRDEKRSVREGTVWTGDNMDSSPECSSVVRRRGFDPTGRRPETWSV
ncbi:hypothetical protein Pmani_037846 [Petrolisthes manimaculis]|uniref:Uncharacterized protein n=1 Tax=Petrolisthes manimaculis TaxID=1843537 RepID=A0AAE1TL14_9EUCA|nr:hypothetical protein Pmani_037846 [Petrolisthes manimaculis]